MTQIQKEILRKVVLLILILLLAYGISGGLDKVFAQSDIPEGVEIFYTCDLVCIVWPDGSGDCYPCNETTCEIVPQVTPMPTKSTPADVPTNIPPTDIPPTAEPQPTPTWEIGGSAKTPCNRGGGNGPEDCDPGNSGGNPGNAGEGKDG